MTCTHQWHDATSSAGPEWVCAKCKVTYSETKKAPPVKRGWVSLTDDQYQEVLRKTDGLGLLAFYNLVNEMLMENNT